jgi:hypothetical protein
MRECIADCAKMGRAAFVVVTIAGSSRRVEEEGRWWMARGGGRGDSRLDTGGVEGGQREQELGSKVLQTSTVN